MCTGEGESAAIFISAAFDRGWNNITWGRASSTGTVLAKCSGIELVGETWKIPTSTGTSAMEATKNNSSSKGSSCIEKTHHGNKNATIATRLLFKIHPSSPVQGRIGSKGAQK